MSEKSLGVVASIIADSICKSGVRITTFELIYPRIVHAELMTHRVFSRNAASSRAVPVSAVNAAIRQHAARPTFWGKNQAGMQSFEENHTLINGYTPDQWWELAASSAVKFSEGFDEAGYHKQVCNRITEAFTYMKVVVTATSYDNWFNLRHHHMADPTIKCLADAMLSAYNDNKPVLLVPGEWHVPYYFDGVWSPSNGETNNVGHTLQEALDISMSCCAQVSYRKLDQSLEKAESIKAKLVPEEEGEPVHASPLEHQATPMERFVVAFDALGAPSTWEDGVTHMDKTLSLWSGNFKHWIQQRQLVPNHVCNDYFKKN